MPWRGGGSRSARAPAGGSSSRPRLSGSSPPPRKRPVAAPTRSSTGGRPAGAPRGVPPPPPPFSVRVGGAAPPGAGPPPPARPPPARRDSGSTAAAAAPARGSRRAHRPAAVHRVGGLGGGRNGFLLLPALGGKLGDDRALGQRGQVLDALKTDHLEEAQGGAEQPRVAGAVLPPHLGDQPAPLQAFQHRLAVHPADLLHARARVRLPVGDARQRLEGGA